MNRVSKPKTGLVAIALISLTLGLAGQSFAADKTDANKAGKAVSCKSEAKKAGITDKAERKAFIKKCKADRKSAKKTS